MQPWRWRSVARVSSRAIRPSAPLTWWVLGTAIVASAAPFVTDAALLLQMGTLGFAVVALFRARGLRNIVIVASAAAVLALVIALQLAAILQAWGLDRYFTQDAVPGL